MGEPIDKTKGKIKQAAGVLGGDKKLEGVGKVDVASGKVKSAADAAKRTTERILKG